MQPGDFFTKLDLTKAYHQVSIDPSFRPYLSFQANNQYFHFNVLPFGLSSAPLILTKALKATMLAIRQRGIRSVVYLDDILIMAQSSQLLLSHTLTAIQELNSRGWKINFQKCSLSPSQQIDYIGAHISSTPSITMSLMPDSHLKLLSSLRFILSSSKPTVHNVRSCLGQLNWALRFNSLLRIFKANLQSQLNHAIRHNHKRILLFDITKQDLIHLVNTPLTSFSVGSLVEARFVISTDATLDVISASIRDKNHILDTSSALDQDSSHIAVKECRAVLMAARHFVSFYSGETVLFSTDNQVVLYALRSASSSNPLIHSIIRQIYLTLLANPPSRIWFSYVPSAQNRLADQLSRPSQENWALNSNLLRHIVSSTGFNPELELFADETNNLLPSFVSSLPNRRALFTDAFSRSWTTLPPLYANPPFSLLFRVLRKILAEKPDILLIAPFWPSSPWFPLLLRANALYRLPRFRHTFSFLGKPAAPPRWSPIVAIFRKDRRSSYREGNLKLISNIPYIRLGPSPSKPSPFLLDRLPLHNVSFLPSDIHLFSQSLEHQARSTPSSIVL
jgi:hypothetical protein